MIARSGHREVERSDVEMVDRWLVTLGIRWRPRSVRRLGGAASAAAVFRLEAEGDCAMLKITSAEAWRTRAQRELRVYRELAGLLPVRVPELLAAAETQTGVGLLISAQRPSGAAADWSGDQWIEAARQAGRLHRHAEISDLPSWLQRTPEPTQDAVLRATDRWRDLGLPAIADRVVDLWPSVARYLAMAPRTIIHGDCHVGNLLLSGREELVWVDWQDVALGAGPEDLALLWQRAEFDGASPPRAQMLKTYSKTRAVDLDDGQERLVLAAELRLLLADWPSFLLRADDRQRRTVLRRLQSCILSWTG